MALIDLARFHHEARVAGAGVREQLGSRARSTIPRHPHRNAITGAAFTTVIYG